MKATLNELELDNKLDKMADKINKLKVKILSLDNLNSIHSQSSKTVSPDSEEDDDYDEYWDDTSENYDEYYEYDKDEDDDYDDISEDNRDVDDIAPEIPNRLRKFFSKTYMIDFSIILDSINSIDGNPIKIFNDDGKMNVTHTDEIYIKNMFLDHYYMMVKVVFDNCLKLIDSYTLFSNSVYRNLKYDLSTDELVDFDKGLQYFMTDDPRLNECGNETVQTALNYVTKLGSTLATYKRYKSNVEIIKSGIRILVSLERI